MVSPADLSNTSAASWYSKTYVVTLNTMQKLYIIMICLKACEIGLCGHLLIQY